MSKAVEVLNRDHRTFVRLLDLIEQEIELFGRAEQPDYALLEAVLEYFEGYPHCAHLPAENLVYDKLMLRAPELCARFPDPGGEHQRHAEQLTALRQLLRRVLDECEIPRDCVTDAARSFIRNMRRHLEMEEGLFLPAARENLRAEDWTEVDALLGESRHMALRNGLSHYDDLRREIMRWSEERADTALCQAG
ncbi:MAG: hemerythrin domain-containing protein [Alphaproteobacteria bacterium]